MQCVRFSPARVAAPGGLRRPVLVAKTTSARRSVAVAANGDGLPIDLRGE